MAVTRYQLPAPAKIRATRFALQRQQAFNPVRGGQHQTVDIGEPLWTCEIDTTELGAAQGGAWKMFLARLRGFARTVLLYDASRRRPLAYRTAADGTIGKIAQIPGQKIGQPRLIASVSRAWGTPIIDAVDRANSRIHVRNLIPGAVISVGDYGAWDDGPARRLHICEAVVADSGGNAWVTVEPAPPSSSAYLPAAFEMSTPCGEFVLAEGSAPYSATSGHQVTLKAMQVLRRS